MSEREFDRAYDWDVGRGAPWPRLGSAEHARRCLVRAVEALQASGETFVAPRRLADWPDDGDGDDGDEPLPRAVRTALCASISAYARRLRAEGLAPEQMLVRVKHGVYEASPQPLIAAALMTDVVRWSIDAYYAP